MKWQASSAAVCADCGIGAAGSLHMLAERVSERLIPMPLHEIFEPWLQQLLSSPQ